MAIIRRLKESLGGGTERESYQYRCSVCHATFESPDSNESAVGCSACGATDVKAV